MGCDCGSGAVCACVLRGGVGVVVTGTGTVLDPWVVAAPLDCDSIMDCVGGRVGSGLAYNTSTRVLSAKVGATSGNLLTIGTDQGLYVPPPTAGTGLLYTAGTKTYSTRYSADAGNTAGAGTDGGIYVPPAGAAGSIAIVANDTNDIDFSGNGTTGAPLTGVLKAAAHTITVTDGPDVDFSGDGSAASPLTAQLALSWAQLSQGDNGSIANSAAAYFKWTMLGASRAMFTPRVADLTYLDCTLAGLYLVHAHNSFSMGAARSTGYVQMVMELPRGTAVASDSRPQGGALWGDVDMVRMVRMAAGDALSLKLNNFTGGAISSVASTVGGWVDIVRLGP
jgi:hypothetical protein